MHADKNEVGSGESVAGTATSTLTCRPPLQLEKACEADFFVYKAMCLVEKCTFFIPRPPTIAQFLGAYSRCWEKLKSPECCLFALNHV